MKRSHFRGELNWRVYSFMATEQTAPGVLLARAMAEGNGLATHNEKTNALESGISHVTWPERSCA